MRCTRYKLILLSTFLLLLKPLFSFSIENFSVDSDYQRTNDSKGFQEGSSVSNGSDSVGYESKRESLNRTLDPTGLRDSLRNKSGISLALVNNNNDKLVPLNAGSPIVFNKILTPAYGSVTQYNGSTIQLNSPGHYCVTWGFGLKTPPANPNPPFILMALQTSSTPNGEYTTYNKYAILFQNSSSVASMTVTVEVKMTTYIQVKNISKTPAELGLSVSTIADYPMAYIDVFQID